MLLRKRSSKATISSDIPILSKRCALKNLEVNSLENHKHSSENVMTINKRQKIKQLDTNNSLITWLKTAKPGKRNIVSDCANDNVDPYDIEKEYASEIRNAKKKKGKSVRNTTKRKQVKRKVTRSKVKENILQKTNTPEIECFSVHQNIATKNVASQEQIRDSTKNLTIVKQNVLTPANINENNSNKGCNSSKESVAFNPLEKSTLDEVTLVDHHLTLPPNGHKDTSVSPESTEFLFSTSKIPKSGECDSEQLLARIDESPENISSAEILNYAEDDSGQCISGIDEPLVNHHITLQRSSQIFVSPHKINNDMSIPSKKSKGIATPKSLHSGENGYDVSVTSSSDLQMTFQPTLQKPVPAHQFGKGYNKRKEFLSSPITPRFGFKPSKNIVTSTPIVEANKITRNMTSIMTGPLTSTTIVEANKITRNMTNVMTRPSQVDVIYEKSHNDIQRFRQANRKTYSGRVFVPSDQGKRKRKKIRKNYNESSSDDETVVSSPTKCTSKRVKNYKESREFQEWALKMNQELVMSESFELAVEHH